MTEVVRLTRQLVDVPSVTGEEKRLGELLMSLLSDLGGECRAQEVDVDRFNVLASWGDPSILLTTHMDTVPPFFTSSEDRHFVYGRGSCDAKGILAAMICAVEALRQENVTNIGLLAVVGEETGSVGARKARELELRCDFVIDGEPSDNQLVVGHKGTVFIRLKTRGIAAHSAYLERGESAIEKLIDILVRLRNTTFPTDPHWGKTSLNIGTLRGGKVANVVADKAEAEVLIRTVAGTDNYLKLLKKVVGEQGEIQLVSASEPQEMEQIEGFPTKVVSYGTDVPFLRSLGKPLLLGPGSILDAHTSDEKVAKSELAEAVLLYQELVMTLRQQIGY